MKARTLVSLISNFSFSLFITTPLSSPPPPPFSAPSRRCRCRCRSTDLGEPEPPPPAALNAPHIFGEAKSPLRATSPQPRHPPLSPSRRTLASHLNCRNLHLHRCSTLLALRCFDQAVGRGRDRGRVSFSTSGTSGSSPSTLTTPVTSQVAGLADQPFIMIPNPNYVPPSTAPPPPPTA
ncbi:uncharacterized protein DS421_18g619560 [Arachis hypogaea]|nr:uncharacterized protein DS421_18g619560 [Arachis hypogaea]